MQNNCHHIIACSSSIYHNTTYNSNEWQLQRVTMSQHSSSPCSRSRSPEYWLHTECRLYIKDILKIAEHEALPVIPCVFPLIIVCQADIYTQYIVFTSWLCIDYSLVLWFLVCPVISWSSNLCCSILLHDSLHDLDLSVHLNKCHIYTAHASSIRSCTLARNTDILCQNLFLLFSSILWFMQVALKYV